MCRYDDVNGEGETNFVAKSLFMSVSCEGTCPAGAEGRIQRKNKLRKETLTSVRNVPGVERWCEFEI